MAPHIIGIDIGGSGIKGAPVDLERGELARERVRLETPEDSTPEAVADLVADVVAQLAGDVEEGSPVGITVPAVVDHGVVRTAANIDKGWIGTDADALFTERLGRPVHVVNDADAAGVAEVRYGAGADRRGVVLLTTLGTGIGSALFRDGELLPNTELGHLEIDGHDAETKASASAREREDMPWKQWATTRLQRYFGHVEFLFSPNLFIVGGGVSKKADKFLPFLELRTPVKVAELRNNAGIVGAALWAGIPHEPES